MYDDNDLQRAMLAEQRRHNEEIENSIGCALIGLACLLAPAAVLTGLYWLAGLGFVVALCAWSWLRTFVLLALGAICLKWIDAEVGYWLVGVGLLNSFVAQWRIYGWDVMAWYEHEK